MKNTWKWIVGVVVVLALLFVLPWLFRSNSGYGYGGMMGGYGNWGHPMMGGFGFSPFGGLFMGFGMLLVWAIPIGLLFFIIYGAVRLAGNSGNQPPAGKPCANCGKPAQADWSTCPYCGEGL